MKNTFRQSMAWLHTWSGLVIGWVLYMMFLAGTASVFKDEISLWMRPEVSRTADASAAVGLAQWRLMQVAPDARRWSINLPDDREPTTQISWTPRDEQVPPAVTRELLDSATGEPLAVRETRGGDLFYRLHYRLEIQGRNGWWFSGAAAVVMLVALVSGIIIHKRIFKDVFTFRSRSAHARSWLDAHNVLAVLLLPFHFVITYTGLVPIMSTVMPWAIVANYAQSAPAAWSNYDEVRSAYSRDSRPEQMQRQPLGEPAPLVSLSAVKNAAERHWNGARIGRISVTNPGDRGALIEVTRHEREQISNRGERLYFAGDTGTLINASAPAGAVSQVSAFMYGLHMVRFADPALRWIVFIVSLAASAMIAAGLIVWMVKRAPSPAATRVPFGYAIVERLNVAGIVGLPIAMAGLFWANRLLPVDMAQRPAAETKVFFCVWVLMFFVAAVRPRRTLWSDQLRIAIVAFGALPLLNAATTDQHLLASLRDGDWIRAGFDLTMLAIAAVFAFAARQMHRAQAVAPRKRRARIDSLNDALSEEAA